MNTEGILNTVETSHLVINGTRGTLKHNFKGKKSTTASGKLVPI